MLRIAALREVGGYNDLLIAGEEPEMCVRLRARGWRIWSNGQEMTLHDVAITRLPQWWHRARRTGYAFAELVALHGQAGDPGWRRLLRSALGWTAINVAAVPGVLLFPLLDGPLPRAIVLAPAALAGVQLVRMARSKRARLGTRRALQWSGLMMVAKAAQTLGWLRFRLQRFTHARATLIEYKA